MINHAKEQHLRSMPLLSLARRCSASQGRLKAAESLKIRTIVLKDAANIEGSYEKDRRLQIESTEMTDNGGGR